VLLVNRVPLAAQGHETRRVRVFLDCSICDHEFVRRELTYVDYVRERRDADVHVLSTSQQTAAGGVELTLEFIGLAGFAGVTDTLTYTAAPAERVATSPAERSCDGSRLGSCDTPRIRRVRRP